MKDNSKEKKIFDQYKASPVSVSPNYLTSFINASGDLERKSPVVVFNIEKGQFDVYRESSSAPGKYSRDIYDISTLKILRKDTAKYKTAPLVPEGSFQYKVKGIICSTRIELDKEYLNHIITTLKL